MTDTFHKLTLLDGAMGSGEALTSEVEAQRRVAADPRQLLEARLEAYEDIIDSQVGDTSLVRARNVERSVGIRQLYLKFEGGNPTGTQKDRIAFAQSMDALRRGFEAIAVATCGNYGVSLATAAALAGLRCLVFIPDTYRTKRINEMRSLNAEIFRVPGDYEAAVAQSSAYAADKEFYDANPGGDNTVLQLQAYGGIAYEIYDELRDAPAVVAVPVSNGSTLAGIYKGFLSLYRRGKTSRMPRMVAGSSFGKNPIVRSYLKGMRQCADLPPQKIRETAVNEPLINWHAIDGDMALEAVYATQGWAADATDRGMRQLTKTIRENEGLQVLPASTAGLIALINYHQKTALSADRFVAVLTGRGF